MFLNPKFGKDLTTIFQLNPILQSLSYITCLIVKTFFLILTINQFQIQINIMIYPMTRFLQKTLTFIILCITIEAAIYNATLDIKDASTLIQQTVVTPQANYLVTASWDTKIRIYSHRENLQLIQILNDSQSNIYGLKATHNMSNIISASKDGKLRIYQNINNKFIIKTTFDEGGKVMCIDMSVDGNVLISGNSDNKVRVYRYNGQKYIQHEILVCENEVKYVAVSSDGRYLVSGLKGHILRLYVNEDGNYKLKQNLNGYKQIIGLGMSGDGFYLGVSYEDMMVKSKLKIYHLKQQMYEQLQQMSQKYRVNSINFGIKPDYMITGGYGINFVQGSTIRVYQLINGQYKLQQTIMQPSSMLSSISSTDDKHFIVAGFSDGRTKLYFSCQAQWCLQCNWKDKCSNCKSSFTLIDQQCLCQSGRSINQHQQCVLCQIQYCVKCELDNRCNLCYNNFSLNQNTKLCQCGEKRSINKKKQCVSCSNQNCMRCEQAEKCVQCSSYYTLDSDSECSLPWYLVFIIILITLLIIGALIMGALIIKSKYFSRYQPLIQQFPLDNRQKQS